MLHSHTLADVHIPHKQSNSREALGGSNQINSEVCFTGTVPCHLELERRRGIQTLGTSFVDSVRTMQFSKCGDNFCATL